MKRFGFGDLMQDSNIPENMVVRDRKALELCSSQDMDAMIPRKVEHSPKRLTDLKCSSSMKILICLLHRVRSYLESSHERTSQLSLA